MLLCNLEGQTIAASDYLIGVVTAYLIVLILANIVVFANYSKHVIRMTFEDSMTISALEDKLTFIINNGGDDQPKIVKVYGHNGPVSIDISGSEFVDADSNKILEINFDLSGSTSKHVDSIGTAPQHFEVYLTNSNPNPIPGAYHGNIFITSAGNQAESNTPFWRNYGLENGSVAIIRYDSVVHCY